MTIEEMKVLLTRTGPATACGDLMRRYWQPAALSEELPPGRAPVPIRLLGEDLVLFRDEQGQPGLLGIHCSHRGADLSYGRLEDGGLRCLYHGWLFDTAGRCLEQPGEPAGSSFKDRIRHQAYPCTERAGVIFAYLGPGEPPLFPNFDFLNAPEGHVTAVKAWQECSYLQANEGNLDLSHLSFLHVIGARYFPTGSSPDAELPHQGEAPYEERAEVELLSYGLRSAKIRQAPGSDEAMLYTTDFILPNLAAFWVGPNGDFSGRYGYSVHWHVPIDDENHFKYLFRFSRRERIEQRYSYFYDTENYRPKRTRANRYLQDRDSMRSGSYTGLGNDFHQHDQWATESQGTIVDFTNEHLGAMDMPIMVERKLLVQAIEDVQAGRDPAGLARTPEQNEFPIVSLEDQLPPGMAWQDYCHQVEAESREVTSVR